MKIWQSLAKLCSCHVCDKPYSTVYVIHIETCGGCPDSEMVVAQARNCVKRLETVLDGLLLLSLEIVQKEKALEESKLNTMKHVWLTFICPK